ncbi:hypothetical protein CRG98_018303 [Punica granatum]|uniref:Uncharacterized protein n=1 Tax=Punica granatum TaxID=22663 RepID=A0A2I0JYI5_PUNGR|nr:hypothetical protein CRG98_018303 [Punica granatum]
MASALTESAFSAPSMSLKMIALPEKVSLTTKGPSYLYKNFLRESGATYLAPVTVSDVLYAVGFHGGPVVAQAHELLGEHEPIHMGPAIPSVHLLHEAPRFMYVDAPEQRDVKGSSVECHAAYEVVHRKSSERLSVAAIDGRRKLIE